LACLAASRIVIPSGTSNLCPFSTIPTFGTDLANSSPFSATLVDIDAAKWSKEHDHVMHMERHAFNPSKQLFMRKPKAIYLHSSCVSN
jgi:hypothetical protein